MAKKPTYQEAKIIAESVFAIVPFDTYRKLVKKYKLNARRLEHIRRMLPQKVIELVSEELPPVIEELMIKLPDKIFTLPKSMKMFACCSKAKQKACVCMCLTTCSVHGDIHHGTHD